MSLVFSPLPNHVPDRILCCYINSTKQIQRIRISSIPNWLFERIVFPRQRLLFESIPDAFLEIQICSSSAENSVHHIPCLRLQVNRVASANEVHE